MFLHVLDQLPVKRKALEAEVPHVYVIAFCSTVFLYLVCLLSRRSLRAKLNI